MVKALKTWRRPVPTDLYVVYTTYIRPETKVSPFPGKPPNWEVILCSMANHILIIYAEMSVALPTQAIGTGDKSTCLRHWRYQFKFT